MIQLHYVSEVVVRKDYYFNKETDELKVSFLADLELTRYKRILRNLPNPILVEERERLGEFPKPKTLKYKEK